MHCDGDDARRAESSRSHSIFVLKVHQREEAPPDADGAPDAPGDMTVCWAFDTCLSPSSGRCHVCVPRAAVPVNECAISLPPIAGAVSEVWAKLNLVDLAGSEVRASPRVK